jgi:cysteinyl-tRNA synthetase
LVRDQLQKAPSGELSQEVADLLEQSKSAFEAAMNDDFNTAQAIGVLFEFNRNVNSLLNDDQAVSQETLIAINKLYQTLGEDVLGLIPQQLTTEANSNLVDGLLKMLIEMRQDARANKDWATADAIRDRLIDLGVTLEDRADGTIWKLTK